MTFIWLRLPYLRGERNFTDERERGRMISFLPAVHLNDPSRTPFTQPLLLTQDCV